MTPEQRAMLIRARTMLEERVRPLTRTIEGPATQIAEQRLNELTQFCAGLYTAVTVILDQLEES